MNASVSSCVALVLAVAATAPAQQLPGWSWVAVDGATAVCCAVRFAGDRYAAPDGAALAARNYRLWRARRAVPQIGQAGALQLSDGEVVWVLADADQGDLALQFVAALLDDAPALDHDGGALALARAALAIDDATWLYPGLVLQHRARHALLGAASPADVTTGASARDWFDENALRLALRTHPPVGVVVLGAASTALQQAAVARQPALAVPPPRPGNEPVLLPPGVRPPGRLDEPHGRIDGPYVAAAALAPGRADWPAFALGIEVARSRAERRFQSRGDEALARAPAVGWSWLRGDPIAVFCRRGLDAGAPAAVRQELQDLLDDLRERAPTAPELEQAVAVLQQELALPPWSDPVRQGLAAVPSSLPARAAALLVAADRELQPGVAQLPALSPSTVQAALRAALAGDRIWWGGLVPASPSPRARRRR